MACKRQLNFTGLLSVYVYAVFSRITLTLVMIIIIIIIIIM